MQFYKTVISREPAHIFLEPPSWTFLSGHNVTKIDFTAANLTFSGLKAIDYFGDGSFYLLNTPGVSAISIFRCTFSDE